MITDRLNYLNESIHFYIGDIFEYDIKHAYPSLLRYTNFKYQDDNLSQDIKNICDGNVYNKKELLIRIGKEIKHNPEISIFINNSLKQLLIQFQEENKIDKDNIISIKKDALFVNKRCNHLNFNHIEFSLKHVYNLYFYEWINKYEYYINKTLNTYSYSIKGLGKNIDTDIYNNLVKIIYITLNTYKLDYLKRIQSLFLDYTLDQIDKIYPYLPSLLPYKDFVYLSKKEYLSLETIEINLVKEIYYQYYHPVFKTLINYIL